MILLLQPLGMGNLASAEKIPEWIKNHAGWWAKGAIGDSDFVSGIQYLMERKIMIIPETVQGVSDNSQLIPSWIRNNADWWSQGLISDDDFVQGIQYLIEEGIMTVTPSSSAEMIYAKANQIHSRTLAISTSYLTDKNSPHLYALSSSIASIEADTTTSLPQQDADELMSQLQNIIDNLNNGQTAAACNQLDLFIAQVTAYVDDGQLTPEEGQVPIDAAQAIKDAAAC